MHPEENPYAPPQVPLGEPVGKSRFYGVIISELKFSELVKLTYNPIVLSSLTVRKWFGIRPAVLQSGIMNPVSAAELQFAEFPPHIQTRLATNHDVLSEHGFSRIGNYRAPSMGLGQIVGEVWIDDQNSIGMNLLFNTLSYPRATVLAEYLSFLSPLPDERWMITTNYPISIGKLLDRETVRMAGAEPQQVINRHRDRIQAEQERKLPPDQWVSSDNVWSYLFKSIAAEVRGLEEGGVLVPLTEAQVKRLMSFDVCLDFRERTVPWFVRLLSSRNLASVIFGLGVYAALARVPNGLWLMFGCFGWLLVTLLLSNQWVYFYLRAKSGEQLPPRPLV